MGSLAYNVKLNCVVTGGTGLVGSHLVEKLVQSGRYNVTYTDLRPAKLDGAKFVKGDITNYEEVLAIVEGADVVYHCAGWLPFGKRGFDVDMLWKVNYGGTENIVNACVKQNVDKLVFVSTEGVCCDGLSSIKYGNEVNLPYATKVPYAYAQSKIQAEQLVRQAYYKHNLLTACIRPTFIFGPGDRNVIPGFVKVGKYFVPGDGKNQRDMVYVTNVVDAIMQAADALAPGNVVCGSAYFISNNEPMPFEQFMGNLMTAFGYQAPKVFINKYLIILLVTIIESYILPLLKMFGYRVNMPVSSNVLGSMTVTQYFDCSKAKKDFGYVPQVSLQEGIKQTADHFYYLKKGYKKEE